MTSAGSMTGKGPAYDLYECGYQEWLPSIVEHAPEGWEKVRSGCSHAERVLTECRSALEKAKRHLAAVLPMAQMHCHGHAEAGDAPDTRDPRCVYCAGLADAEAFLKGE